MVEIVEEGRAEEYYLIRAIKAAQRMRLKKRGKDESLIRRSFYRGSNPFSPKRERRGRPCWVASAIFGRTRTKKAG